MQADRYMRDEEMRKQEELTRKQEAVRRKTLEYEAELRQQTELARVKAETEGKIRQERENHDLRLEEAREGAKEYRDTVLEGEFLWASCSFFILHMCFSREACVDMAYVVFEDDLLC